MKLFNAAEEYKIVSLEKPKPNLSLSLLFCHAAMKKGGTDQTLVCQLQSTDQFYPRIMDTYSPGEMLSLVS